MRRIALILAAAAIVAVAVGTIAFFYFVPHGETRVLPRSANGQTYVLFVDVPAGCTPLSPCPTLYLLDGERWFNDAKAVAQRARAQGVRSFVIVGIGYRDLPRTADLRKFDFTPSFGKTPGRATGGADAYLGVLRNEIIPYAEQHYPIDPRRRVLAAHSYGGLLGTYALLRSPDLFEHMVIISPALWFDNYGVANVAPAPYSAARLVIVASDTPAQSESAMARDVRRLEQRLRGIPHLTAHALILPGTTHTSVVAPVLAQSLPELFRN